MNNLQVVEQKLVDFNGAEIMGVKTNDKKVRVGVRWVCEGIGLTRGQMNNESKKVVEDQVLKQGARNLVLPTKGGRQEVLTIELDFLPLWLAKISITPKMQEEAPNVANSLVQYQLKAKDVLAQAFLPQIQPLSEEQQSREHLKLSIMTSERVDKIESKVDEVAGKVEFFENTMRIDGVQEFKLRSQGQAKVLEVLDGIESSAYKQVGRKAFAELWREFKRHFQIPRYSELAKSQFDEGVYFISKWRPSTSLQIEIEQCNHQIQLKLVKVE